MVVHTCDDRPFGSEGRLGFVKSLEQYQEEISILIESKMQTRKKK